MASASSSATFYTTFQSLKTEINHAIEASDISKASKLLVDLKAQFRNNVSLLPAYDERSYDTQIRELDNKLSTLRPKTSKFSFVKSKSKFSKAIPPSQQPVRPTESTSTRPEASRGIQEGGGDAIRFENLTGRRLRLEKTSSTSSTVILSDLEGCIIDLRPLHPSALDHGIHHDDKMLEKGKGKEITSVHAQNLKRCILLAPINGSILLHKVQSCILVISSHQFRMHDSSNTTVLISIPSMPIIEHSSNIAFGPLSKNILPDRVASNTLSRHHDVQDFDWVREGQSPNWKRLSDSEKLEGILGEATEVENEAQVGNLIDQALSVMDP